MKQYIYIICVAFVGLSGCDKSTDLEKDVTHNQSVVATNNNYDADTRQKALQDYAKEKKHLLSSKHKQEKVAFDELIKKERAALERLQKEQQKEITTWKKKRNGEIKSLEMNGYKYVKRNSSTNPRRKTPAIVKEIADRHDREWREIKARHKRELKELEATNKSKGNTTKILYARQKGEIEILENEVQQKKRNIIRDFVSATGVEVSVNVEKLVTNPYVYEGKIVLMKAMFTSMLSRNDALFARAWNMGRLMDSFLVTGVPTTRFSEEKKLLLVGKVRGKTRYKMPSGNEVLVTHVDFVDAYEGDYNESDIVWAVAALHQKQ